MRRIQSIAYLASASADQRAPYAAKRLLELFPDALLGVSNQNNAIYDEPHEETGQFVVELQRAVLRVIFWRYIQEDRDDPYPHVRKVY